MKKNKNEKKSFAQKNKGTLLAILVILVLAVGGSYAWFTLILTGEKTTVIRAGKLSLKLDETTSNGISLSNTYPLTDQEGLDTTKYTFTVTNDGTITNNYTIYLDNNTEAENKIDEAVIKYNFEKTEYVASGSVKNEKVTTLQLLSDVQTEKDVILDTGILEPGEYNEYSLQLWMDYDAGNEYQDASYDGRLRITGTQIKE